MSLGPRVLRSFGYTSANKEWCCRGMAREYCRRSRLGGASAGRVARSILEEAEALPSRKEVCHAAAWSGMIMPSVTQGLSALPGREVYERRLSPRAGERNLTREGSFPYPRGKKQTRRHGVTPVSHRRPVRGAHTLRRDPRVPP
jgi:hypothetical protein